MVDNIVSAQTKNKNEYLKTACEYIEANYHKDIAITDIAAHVAIDRTYLYRLFLREKGIPPSKYLQNIRMERAKEMIGEGKIPLSEVLLLVGFKNRARFGTMFKKMYGVTPLEYMKMQNE